jgi:beta-galactosidase/beta-glucuronidase
MVDNKHIPRPEYPRPQFVRENNWLNLNGKWDFAFDNENIGLKEKWYKKGQHNRFDKNILVPFCFQSKLSGIEDNSFHDVVWYRREFIVPESFLNKRVFLHFGAVDYSCNVYINDECIGTHSGGYIGFNLDITDYIEKRNLLVLRVEDPSTDLEIPRGKQFWEKKFKGIYYPRVTGIWQTVWLESVSLDYHINDIKLSPDIDNSEVLIECEICGVGFPELNLMIEISFKNNKITEEEIELKFLGKFGRKRDKKLINEREFKANPNRFSLKVPIPENLLYLWDTENPNLYDITLKVFSKKSMEIYDEIKSYFGMRKISVSETLVEGYDKIEQKGELRSLNKQVLLNNKPIYQKLFLVQGYWPDGLYTAPSDEAIKLDIKYVKDFGFNGLRTHQKTFDQRFLYWCDKMGVLVWGEIGNAFRFSMGSQLRLINEFVAEIERDYNHPSIIVWTILNEGWGVPEAYLDQKKAHYTTSLYYLMKSIDSTRLIVDDDGWWHTKTDLCTKHFYIAYKLLPKSFEREKRKRLPGMPVMYLKPYKYNNEPIIYSEIGGYGFDVHGDIKKKWGYENVDSDDELFEKVLHLLKLFDERKAWVHGFCYTELYDQFQEINGLLTMDRKPKFPPERLKKELDNLFY